MHKLIKRTRTTRNVFCVLDVILKLLKYVSAVFGTSMDVSIFRVCFIISNEKLPDGGGARGQEKKGAAK